MTIARGYLSKAYIAEESAFKTAPTTGYEDMAFNTLDIKASQTLIDSGTISGTRNSKMPARGHITADGSATIPVDSDSFGVWCKMMFGDPTTTALEDENEDPTGLYQHVFKIQNEQPSFTLVKAFQDINQYFVYTGCKINSCSFTAGDDGALDADFEIIGCDEEIKTAAPIGIATADTPVFDRLNNFSCVLKKDDAIVSDVKTMDVKLSMGIDGSVYLLGSKGRGVLPESICSITGTLHTVFENTAWQQLGEDDEEISLELTFTNGDKSLSFKFPQVKVNRTSPGISGPAGIECEVEWQAYQEGSENDSSVIVTLINETASY